jgi:hypothetical protein
MELEVLKFGGSSLATAAAMERVAQVLWERRDTRRVVVCSAMGGVTNDLLELGRAAGQAVLPSLAALGVSAIAGARAVSVGVPLYVLMCCTCMSCHPLSSTMCSFRASSSQPHHQRLHVYALPLLSRSVRRCAHKCRRARGSRAEGGAVHGLPGARCLPGGSGQHRRR